VSSLEELADDAFRPLIDDPAADPALVGRVVMCAGKVYYDLLKAKEEKRRSDVALVRVEQLYPFPGELGQVLARYTPSAELVWCQEEPQNMGAWRFVRERFLDGEVSAGGRLPRYAGRKASASPAAGTLKAHNAEQETLVADALS
jgi:2-oxoglutarate dehydrogenase E1 component